MNFTFRGCSFKIGIPFLSLVTLTLILDKSGKFIWCLFAMLIHELGHIFCMMSQHKKLRKMQFCLFDIKIIDSEGTLRSYKDDIFLMFAGSFANFLTALLFCIINCVLRKEFLNICIVENVLIGIFNLLPIDSLDGGQILLIFLKINLDEKKATSLGRIISIIFLLPVTIMGVCLLLKSRYNFSLFLVSIYLFVRFFLSDNKYMRWSIKI